MAKKLSLSKLNNKYAKGSKVEKKGPGRPAGSKNKKSNAGESLVKAAASLEKVFGGVLRSLIDKGIVAADALNMEFSSGGGFEHFIVQMKDGYWLMFGNMSEFIDRSKVKYATTDEMYDAFWDEDGMETKYVTYSEKGKDRPVADIVKDIEMGKWKEFGESSDNTVHIEMKRKKYVLIDDQLNKMWANEYFSTIDEAKDFAKQNNLHLSYDGVVSVPGQKLEKGGRLSNEKIVSNGAAIVAKYKGKINSQAKIREFFQDLYKRMDMAFHPDDDFNEMSVDLPKKTGDGLNTIMEQCFKYCEKNKLDIYEIGLEESPLSKERNAGKFEAAEFEAELNPEVKPKTYSGYHDPTVRFSYGFVPYFSKETSVKILKDAGVKHHVSGKRIFANVGTDDKEVMMVPEIIKVDGKEISAYDMGNGWPWLRVDDSFKKGGRTKQAIASDKSKKALHPGKRRSASGQVYWENRANKSDVNRTKKFAGGGIASSAKAFYRMVSSLMKQRYGLGKEEFDWDMEAAEKEYRVNKNAEKFVEDYATKYDLSRVDGGGYYEKGGKAKKKNVSNVTQKDIEEAVMEDDLNLALATLQDKMGQSQGDIAGIFFADHEDEFDNAEDMWKDAGGGKRRKLIHGYLDLEKVYSDDEDENDLSKLASGRYIDLRTNEHDNLVILLNEEGREFLEDHEEPSEDLFYEMFEDIMENSELKFHNDLGDAGLGMTSAPGITDGYFHSESGTGFERHDDARLWYYDNYAITNFLQKLKDEGTVLFHEHKEYSKGGSTSEWTGNKSSLKDSLLQFGFVARKKSGDMYEVMIRTEEHVEYKLEMITEKSLVEAFENKFVGKKGDEELSNAYGITRKEFMDYSFVDKLDFLYGIGEQIVGDGDAEEFTKEEAFEKVGISESYSKGGKMKSQFDVDTVLLHYMVAALWSSSDNSGEEGEEATYDQNLDANYGVDDIDPTVREKMRADIEKFLTDNNDDLVETGLSEEQIGHTFWLARQRHGSGWFDYSFDDDLEKRLETSTHSFKENDLYVGDDGKIHASGYYEDGGKPAGSTGLFAEGGTPSPYPFKREIGLGKIDYDGRGRKINAVSITCEVKVKDSARSWETLEEVTNVPELTASGKVWNSKKSDIVAGGQMFEELLKFFRGNAKVKRIVEIWKVYHLNDLKSGTKVQMDAIKEGMGEAAKWRYEEEVEYLKSIGLYEDRGYKYGHGWLYMPIPEEIIKEFIDLANSFPEFEKFEQGGQPGGSGTPETLAYAETSSGESFAKGGTASDGPRVPNAEARIYSENMLPFRGSNLEGKTMDNGDYMILSYGHYPLWYWSKKEDKWYGNSTKYSVTTSMQFSQSRPTYEPVMIEHPQLLEKLRDNETHYDLGGVMIRTLNPMSVDNTLLAHEGSAAPSQNL